MPTLHEREHYCRDKEFGRCPTFRIRQARAAALSEEAYYALWLPWANERQRTEQEATATGESV